MVPALQMMEKAYQLDPENEEVWFQLGSLYYDTQQYDLARGFAERLVIRAPSERRYLYLLGLLQVATGQWGLARASLEQVVQLHPGMAEAYDELGNLAMEESQPARAVKAYQHALETSPQNSAYRKNLEAAERAAARKN
jgi:cytochrome c-type biogenesis protein CcmH/NrfG